MNTQNVLAQILIWMEIHVRMLDIFQNLVCSCTYQLLYWKHVHTRRNKERKEQREGRKDSLSQWKELESESQPVLVCRLRSVPGKARGDLEILFHGNSRMNIRRQGNPY